ncbi:MAG: hypothetical protein Q6364_07620 [Candidatus Hermodarchaeota archaeon]|nr:hypothetical protein [Candidatus Hermodarchaeota archaeon]
MKTTFTIPESNLSFQQLLEQIEYYLLTGWNLLLLIGIFNAVLLIALGLINWFTGSNPKKGKKMVLGGIILFIAIQWFVFNPPWQYIFG